MITTLSFGIIGRVPCRNATETCDSLNARFANGKPTSKLHYAGVVLRAYDNDPRTHPPESVAWLTRGPHPSGVLSASVVNARAPYAYAGTGDGRAHLGVVYSPAAAHAGLTCSYPRDAASIYVRGSCVPGQECGASAHSYHSTHDSTTPPCFVLAVC